jgi:hypothetical protein
MLELFVATPWWVPIPVAVVFFGVGMFFWYLLIVKLAHAPWNWSAGIDVGVLAGGVVLLIGLFAQLKKGGYRKLLKQNQSIAAIRQLDWRRFETLISAAYFQRGIPTREGRPPWCSANIGKRKRWEFRLCVRSTASSCLSEQTARSL